MESRMSRNILIFFTIFIFLLTCVSAEVIDFYKDAYMSGDTVQAEIDFGNVTLINPFDYSNVKLYNNQNKIPLNLNLYKLKDKYFIFFNLPALEAKDYNFVLENIVYSDKGTLKKESFSKNLSVIDGRGVSVYPALIYLNIESWENPRFAIEIKNKASDDIALNFESGSEYIKFNKEGYLLKPGESYFLSMVLDMRNYQGNEFNSEVVVKYFNDSYYNIPIIINKFSKNLIVNEGKVEEIKEISTGGGEIVLLDGVDKIERSLRKEDSLEGPLRFKNSGSENLYGLNFELTNDLNKIVRIKYEGDNELDLDEEENIYVYINENKNISKNYSGDLVIKAGNKETKLLFNINYIPAEVVKQEIDKVNEINYSYNYYNYSAEVYKPKEKPKIWLYILVSLGFIVLIYIAYYLYKKGKPESKKFESLIPTFGKR